jgi:antimicrobial peptide system SdpA family protein
MKLTFLFLSLIVFWAGIFLLSLGVYLPEAALPIKKYSIIKTFFPQGWAFFTRSPRESQTQLFVLDTIENTWKKVNQQHAQMGTFWGASKKMTKFSYELKDIFQQIPENFYIDCKTNIQIGKTPCIPESIQETYSNLDHPILQGEYLVVIQAIVPWPWSKHIEEVQMPSKVARIKVQSYKHPQYAWHP